MEEAAYIALLAKAFPGLFDNATDDDHHPITPYDYIRDHLPYAQGRALLHAAAVISGQVMIWPDPQLSRRGRWWLKVKRLWQRPNKEAHQPSLGEV